MAKLDLLGRYLDYQRKTMLLRTDGLSGEPLYPKALASELTLGGLLYHRARVGRMQRVTAGPLSRRRSDATGLSMCGTTVIDSMHQPG
jgi:hypothetical protein